MTKPGLETILKPSTADPKYDASLCNDCGRSLPYEKDRIECKGEKCICPDCYRDVVAPCGGKRHDSHGL